MITQINMSSIFLSILLLFVIFLHVAQMRPAKEQLAFLLMQVFLFIFLIALAMEILMSDTVSSAYLALKFEYFGLCCYLMAMSWFLNIFARLQAPKWLYTLQLIICMIVLAGSLSMEYHPWFYKTASIIYEGEYPRIDVTRGWIWTLYYIWFVLVYLTTIFGSLRQMHKEHGIYRRRLVLTLIGCCAMMIEVFLKALGVFGEYNPVSVAIMIQTFCNWLAFVRYGYFSELENSRDAFLAAMSHEMRMPLNSILAMNDLILMDSHDPAILEYASKSKASCQTLLDLVNDIIDYSQMESGQFVIEEGAIPVQELFTSLYALAEPMASRKNLKLFFQFDSPMPARLSGDQRRLEQILSNLLSNALKFTRQGTVLLSVSYQEGLFTASVEDTGIGIREENLAAIFLPFERVDTSKNSNIEGTGLGLAICQNLAKRMHGTLTVKSCYGFGSKFTLALPMRPLTDVSLNAISLRSSPAFSKNPDDVPKAAPKGTRILAVDDNEMNLFVLKKFLERMNISADVAENGEIALKLTAKNPYALLLLDYKMSDMNGGELLKKIRSQKKAPCQNTPAVVITAYTQEYAHRISRAWGFEGCLTKPVSLKQLERCVFSFLPALSPEKPAFGDLPSDQASLYRTLTDSGIQVKKGLSYSAGDPELYWELLSLFVSGEDPAASWNALFSEKKWRELEVAIHALKNNAMSLGMEALAGQAKEAEDHTRTQALSKQELNALLSSVTAMRQTVQAWLRKQMP